MRRVLTSVTLGLALAIALFGATLASAGPLATHPLAYDDGTTVWHGSTGFDDDGDPLILEGDGLEGSVDWAVFTSADFETAFPALIGQYIPPAGQLAYTYQINVAGIAVVSSLSVGIDDEPTGTIGYFSGGGVSGKAPTSVSLAQYSANFGFVGNNVPVGSSSRGLVFSSPNVPMDFFGSVIDGGSSAFVIPLPSPSSIPIPEPSTLALAGLVLVLLGCRRWFRLTT